MTFSNYRTFPLTFSDPDYCVGIDQGALSLGYRVIPSPGRQRVQTGRFLVDPDIDLNQYEYEAVFDWVEIGFRTRDVHQSRNVQSYAARELAKIGSKSTIFASGIARKRGYLGQSHVLRVFDPNPHEIQAIVAALDRKYAIIPASGEARFTVPGFELSIDIYPKRNVGYLDEAIFVRRVRMTQLIRNHVYVSPAFFVEEIDRPRIESLRGSIPLVEPVKNAHRRVVATATKLGVERRELRGLDPKAHNKPDIDGTFYVGRRNNEIHFRLQDKISDRRSGHSAEQLKPNETRTRIEVTCIKSDEDTIGGPASIGINSIEDFFGFRFDKFLSASNNGAEKAENLRKILFDFHLPTISADGKSEKGWNEDELEIFGKTGCTGLEWHQRAKQVIMKAEGVLVGARARFDTRNGKGYRLAYRGLNERVQKRLKKLSSDWGA